MRLSKTSAQGFTLIEISVVMVIIGLITGAIMYGQDLVQSSRLNAQITQINKYNTAANTFNTKYGALPGDIGNAKASQFGLVPRFGLIGTGNEDGILQGICVPCSGGTNYGWSQNGETVMFWEDLSSAKFIDATFNTAVPGVDYGYVTLGSTTYTFSNFFPTAKIGQGNFVYAYSNWNGQVGDPGDGTNYFGLSVPTTINGNQLNSSTGLSVAQAYSIDKKMDDGMPTQGWVQANYLLNGISASPNASSAAINTCYDTTTNQYSTTVTGGTFLNCALSFQFQ